MKKLVIIVLLLVVLGVLFLLIWNKTPHQNLERKIPPSQPTTTQPTPPSAPVDTQKSSPQTGISTQKVAPLEQIQMETSLGTIVVELDGAKAPKTVENFLGYVNSGFYDGTIFHRVIPGFMAQGGGFTPDMNEKATKAPIANEADNGLKNLRGTLAMARTPDPNSATAQFFINLVDNAFLDFRSKTEEGWGYCVFGKVTKGMTVVDAIARTQTTTKGMNGDVPVTPIVIKKMTVVKVPIVKAAPAPAPAKK